MTLEWHQHDTDPSCFITACGRYSVSFDFLVQKWRAWRMAPGGPWFAPIGKQFFESCDEAERLCEDDCRRALH